MAESVADPRTLARIAEALRAAEAADRKADAEAFIEANARFHAAWHDLVANRRLLRAIALNAGHVRYLRMLTLNNAAARKAALAGMKKILATLRTRDGERARSVMRDHLRRRPRAPAPGPRRDPSARPAAGATPAPGERP